MTTPTYAAALEAALGISSTRESIQGIKSVVAREIEATDTSARIRDTGYFNHSYMPDFVLEWPDDEAAGQRFMYLKFSGDADYFARDVALVEDREPIVFSIGHHRNARAAQARLAAETGAVNTLLTDADGLATMIERRDRSPDVRIISTALTQDGRGFLDAENASLIADGFSQGIDAARSLAVEGTRHATDIVTARLRRRQSRLLNQFLQAVWVGSGGSIERFPGVRDLSGEIADSALEFLLSGDEIVDPEFWRRLGRHATLEQLTRLKIGRSTRNLQHFITHNIDVLWARAFHLQQTTDSPTEEPAALEWAIERKLLSLRSAGFSAYFDTSVEELRRKTSGARTRGISLAVLLERAAGTVVAELEITADRRSIVYRSDESIDITRDERLAALAASLGPDARVTRARIPVTRDRNLVCDFTAQIVAPRGPSKVPMSELLVCLPLLHELTSAETTELSVILESAAGKEAMTDHSTVRLPPPATGELAGGGQAAVGAGREDTWEDTGWELGRLPFDDGC
ncbi:hypothetical protein [Frankia sp. CcI49]|uniref:hypothetical protein n=1 Tax=Frankia sp. CcI49 TaxID=1745382 RepID=UPI0018E9FC76|nr:hypothetical protein [Frankia sp. CcI49]